MSKLLFICSKNQWRSPTAELLFKDHPLHNARSAGTSDKARIKVNQKLIDWADVICFMEKRHKDIIKQRFSIANQKLVILDIEDRYQYADPELIELLKISMAEYF